MTIYIDIVTIFTYNIYIWLDASLIDTSLDNSRFAAKISADTVQITGNY